MTEEADARVRLLAYYEDRLILLAGKIATLEEGGGSGDLRQARAADNSVKRFRGEIADIREKARRLRDAIASG